VLVGLLGFALAGRRIGEAAVPTLHGAIAAVISYLLAVPIILLGGYRPPLAWLALPLLGAVVVGAAAGQVAGRMRIDTTRRARR
jgi:hypothetical protein